MSRIHEFFEDVEKQLSMGRLNAFQAMLIGGVVIVILAVIGKLSSVMFGAYLSAGVGHGIVSKVSDSMGNDSAPDSTSDPVEDATDATP